MIDDKDKEFSPTKIGIIAGSIFVILLIFFFIFSPFTIVEPGEVGLVKVLGKLHQRTLEPGFHVVSPISSIIKLTTKFNSISTQSSVLTEDNLTINVEVTLFYKLMPGKYKYIYSNFGGKLRNIEKTILSPAMHSAVREACSTMDWDTLSTHREQLRVLISKKLNVVLKEKGFSIKNVMINDIEPPQKIKNAVMAKLQAQQEVMQMAFEKQKAIKEAQIKIVEATGIAKAQQIIQKRLTPLYVQYYAIQAYKKLATSKNTTFVIMPTNPKGSGLPMILNAEPNKK